MFYLVQKFEHEMLVEDTFEGNTFDEAIANAYAEGEERGWVIMGTEIPEDENEDFGTPKKMVEWIKENNYEFTRVIESASPLNPILYLG
jgi:hypothetical protein